MTLLANMVDLIPAKLKQKALDALVDFVSGEAKKYVSQELANKIKKLRSDASFNNAFEEGLQKATTRFVKEYEIEDEDLVAEIDSDKEFFTNEEIQTALLKIIKHPGKYLIDEREKIFQSFDTVLPTRKNRERVDRAVTYFLKCLAEELWQLPELHPIYSLQFQRMTADASQQQVELQKAQLQALARLNTNIRESLLVLTDAIVEKKALPSGERYALPEKPTVYHNLPQPEYGKFIGRETELKKIARILHPYPHSQHSIVTIDGIGGIGKSALALEIAHRYLRNYERIEPEKRFDAIIWTSAKQTVLTAEGISIRRQALRTLDDIYTAIAITLQREDITHAHKEEQYDIVCNALTQQRTLLIVDNLETVDDEAVMDFLREIPAPSKVIVTTRHRLDVAYPVRLAEMPWKDAQQLIKQECHKKGVFYGDNLDEIQEEISAQLSKDDAYHLYERTGGVPLAIVWSIAQMGFGYNVASVLARLGHPSGDIARFCFEGAVEQIQGKPSYILLITLSLCSDDASRETLGYATELSELDRDDGLVELEKLSLVNKRGDRFSFLPLTKHFASSEFQKSARKEQLQENWIEYFKILSEKYSGEHWKWTNYDWLLSEGNNILLIIDHAISSNIKKEKVLSFSQAAMRYLDIEGRWNELADYGEKLSMIAQALNNKRSLAWICVHWLGWLYAEQERYELAEKFTQRSLLLYQELNEIKGICFTMTHLARVFRRIGKYDAAEKICNEAMVLAEKHGYSDEITSVHFQLGKIAQDQGEWKKAKTYFESVINWCEEHENEIEVDFAVQMLATGNLGWVEYHLENYQHGKELTERSLEFFESMGGKGQNSILHLRLAIIENALNNKENALKHLNKALFWMERLGMVKALKEAKILQKELSV